MTDLRTGIEGPAARDQGAWIPDLKLDMLLIERTVKDHFMQRHWPAPAAPSTTATGWRDCRVLADVRARRFMSRTSEQRDIATQEIW